MFVSFGLASSWLKPTSDQHFECFSDVLHADHQIDIFVLPERQIAISRRCYRRSFQCQTRNPLLLELRHQLDQMHGQTVVVGRHVVKTRAQVLQDLPRNIAATPETMENNRSYLVVIASRQERCPIL